MKIINVIAVAMLFTSLGAHARATSPLQRVLCSKMRFYLLNDTAGRDQKTYEDVSELNCNTLRGYEDLTELYCRYKDDRGLLDTADWFVCRSY